MYIHMCVSSAMYKGFYNIYRTPTTLDDDMLRTELEQNPHQRIGELPKTHNQSWSTIREYLKQTGKVSRVCVWV